MLTDWLRIRRSFRGGIFLPDEKAVSARRMTERLTPEGLLNVPLRHARDLPTRPVVRVGESVRAGDTLAEAAAPESLSVFSPAGGRVAGLGRAWTARDGWLPAAMIEPGSTGEGSADPPQPPTTIAELSDLARRFAVLDFVARRPLHALLNRPADTLIVNAVETEPNVTGELRTLVEQAEAIIGTIERLVEIRRGGRSGSRAWGTIILAVPLRHGRLVRRLRGLAAGRRVRVLALEDKFPQCHPVLLTKVLLDREVAPGSSPLDVGALVLPLATVRALGEALTFGRPCTSRVVTVSGDAVERPGNFIVPFGTPVRRLIELVGQTRRAVVVLAGGPMTGTALPDDTAVITGDVAGLTLMPAVPRAEPTACVRCGWCVDDCPVGIDPRALTQLELRAELSGAERSELATCIECGVCTYVCPSALPLAATIAASRRRAAAEANT